MNSFILIAMFPLLASQLQASDLPLKEPSLPIVEQHVECISICHMTDGVSQVYFWDMVQNTWTCLDTRWLSSQAMTYLEGDKFVLILPEEACIRKITTKCWVESWEITNPLAEQNQRPWFRQLLNPGLRKPR